MRAPSEVLRRARETLAGGWSPGLSVTSQGAICHPEHEGIERYCVHDALRLAAGGDAEALVAAQLELDGLRYAARDFASLVDWELARGRTHADVLSLFHCATKRALAKEST